MDVQHRIDIQIMRGIAVLVVVLYHLEFSLFRNGFLGVDIFFVISGFLMAILYQKGQVAHFYKRRASRLLPAYFATIIFTLVASALITLAADHSQVVTQSLWASVFSSNIGFWTQSSYFSPKFFNPLLHLWSLGVEIQFYIIVPFLFWLYSKSKWSIPLILISSLLGAVAISLVLNTKTSFFLTPFRVWQFLAGAFVAYIFTNKGAILNKKPLIGLISLVVLTFLVLFYPINIKNYSVILGHPGLVTLLTTIMTVLILAYGLPSSMMNSRVGRLLAKLGDWSYSIYLAHFPVIVLFLYEPLSGTTLKPNGMSDTFFIIVLIAIFSSLLYIIFDKNRWNVQFKTIAITVTGTILLAMLSTPLAKIKHSDMELNIMASYEDKDPFRCGRIARELDNLNVEGKFACEITSGLDGSAEPVLLLGDSTADSLKFRLAEVAEKHNFRIYTTASNEAGTGGLSIDKIINETKKLNIKTIILHFWSPNVDGFFKRQLNEKLIDAGFNVVWISSTPYFEEPVPKLVYQNKENYSLNFTPENYDQARSQKNQLIANGIKVFDPWPLLCDENQCELRDKQGHAYYHDKLHLSLTGSDKLKPLFNEVLEYIKD